MVRCASAALALPWRHLLPDDKRVAGALRSAQIVFVQGPWLAKIKEMIGSSGGPDAPLITAPRLYFPGFHPDMATPSKAAGKCPNLPLGTANSAILLAAWSEGFGPDEAITLFRDEVYEALGYYEAFDAATELLVRECGLFGVDVRPLMGAWKRPFFHVPLHPKIEVLNDVALALLHNAGIETSGSAPPVADGLSINVIWPVYPEIGERLGVEGSYIFRPNCEGAEDGMRSLTLEQFIERTFAGYHRAPPDLSQFPRMSDSRLQSIGSFVTGSAYDAFGSADWLEADAAAAVQVICDEELLDRDDD